MIPEKRILGVGGIAAALKELKGCQMGEGIARAVDSKKAERELSGTSYRAGMVRLKLVLKLTSQMPQMWCGPSKEMLIHRLV